MLSQSPKSPTEMELASSLGASPGTGFIKGDLHGGGGTPVGIGGRDLPPLSCGFLLSLSLNGCENLTFVMIDGPVLAKFEARRCAKLEVVKVDAPKLNTLDVSDCVSLEHVGLHEKSMRGLRVAKLTGCKLLNETFVHKLVGHCKALRQLHLYGSGASAVASNSERRKKVKTKKGLEKIIKQNPKVRRRVYGTSTPPPFLTS